MYIFFDRKQNSVSTYFAKKIGVKSAVLIDLSTKSKGYKKVVGKVETYALKIIYGKDDLGSDSSSSLADRHPRFGTRSWRGIV